MKYHEKNADKHRRISYYIRARLLMTPPGKSLPSLRKMMLECGCGKDVLMCAIMAAERDGLLERRLRSGYYRVLSPQKTQVNVAVYAAPDQNQLAPVGSRLMPSYAFSIVQHLQQLARERSCSFALATDLKDLPDKVETLFAVCVQNLQTIRQLEKKYSRLIAISGCGSKLWAKPPYAQGTAFGIRHLFSLGHRRIGFLYQGLNDSWPPDKHLYEYYKTMAQYGLQVSENYVVACSDNASIFCGLKKMMTETRPPTAILTLTCWLSAIYQVLESLHKTIPADVSVLGIGSPESVSELYPIPSLVYDSPCDLADVAWEMQYQTFLKNMIFTSELHIEPGKTLRRISNR